MKKMPKLWKIEQKVERAREKLYAALREQDEAAGRFLTERGWKRIYAGRGLHNTLWLSTTGRAFTTFAAVREQRARDTKNAKARARKARRQQAPA